MTEKVPAPEKKEYVVVERTPEEIKGIEDAAREFLDSVFKAMEVPVEITIVYQKNTEIWISIFPALIWEC